MNTTNRLLIITLIGIIMGGPKAFSMLSMSSKVLQRGAQAQQGVRTGLQRSSNSGLLGRQALHRGHPHQFRVQSRPSMGPKLTPTSSQPPIKGNPTLLQQGLIKSGTSFSSIAEFFNGESLAKDVIIDLAKDIYQRVANGLIDGSLKKIYSQLTSTNREQLIWELMRLTGLSRNEIISRFMFGANCGPRINLARDLSLIDDLSKIVYQGGDEDNAPFNLYFVSTKSPEYQEFMEQVLSSENGEGNIIIPKNRQYRRKKGANPKPNESLIKVEVEIPKGLKKEDIVKKDGLHYTFLRDEIKLKVKQVSTIKQDSSLPSTISVKNRWVIHESLFENSEQ